MSEEDQFLDRKTKTRIVYVIMAIAGVGFVSTLILPVSQTTAQFLSALLFGVMTGLWLSHLVYNL